MKKNVILFIAFMLFSTIVKAQSPQGIPYQGVARNASGELLASQPIMLRMSIHDVTTTGTVVYSETHSVATTNLGQFSITIGLGTPINGTLASINWGIGAKFLQVELSTNAGNSYVDMGTTQFMSVPYALYAGSSGIGGVKKAKITYEYPFGSLATNGSWYTALLNTVRYDDIGITLVNNQITLPMGKYEVTAYSTFGNARGAGFSWIGQLRVLNVTSNTVIAKSILTSLVYNNIINGSAFPVLMNDERFILSTTSVIELQNFFYSGRYGIYLENLGETLTELIITKLE